MISLSDKHILITGGSSGIGRETSILCNNLGAKISIVGRNEIELNNTISKLNPMFKSQYFTFDVSNFENIENLIQAAVQSFGKIDGFVHSAGVELTKPLKMLSPKNLQDAFNINVFSAFEFSKIVSKTNNYNQPCSFVFISSIVALLGQSGKIGYSASKGALVSGARSMAMELQSKGIRVNCILPGLVETEMSKKIMDNIGEEAKNNVLKSHPLGFGQPIDIAQSIAFLLSDWSRWITGTSLIVDGGFSIH